MGVPEKERKWGAESFFKEIMTKAFPNIKLDSDIKFMKLISYQTNLT